MYRTFCVQRSAICDLILVRFLCYDNFIKCAPGQPLVPSWGYILFPIGFFFSCTGFPHHTFFQRKKRQLMGDCLISVELMEILDDSVDVKL